MIKINNNMFRYKIEYEPLFKNTERWLEEMHDNGWVVVSFAMIFSQTRFLFRKKI